MKAYRVLQKKAANLRLECRCMHVGKQIVTKGLMVCIGLLLAEVLLRFIPSEVQYPARYEYDDPRSLLGIELLPSTKHTVRLSCLSSVVTTNSHGWRDRERIEKKPQSSFRIAVLGDSFIEGSQVNDAETITRQLETLIGTEFVEVLNFGLSSIGTVQEEILYKHVVSKYDPDIVIVAFYSNDVLNSHPKLDGGPEKKTRLTFRDEEGNLIHYREETVSFSLRRWLRTHSAVFRLAKKVHSKLQKKPNTHTDMKRPLPDFPPEYAVFTPPTDPVWTEAWNQVERALLLLQDQLSTEQKLYLFLVPEMLQIAPEYPSLIEKEYGKQPPPAFNPLYPHERLKAFAKKQDIPVIDPIPAFRRYQEAEGISYPYFFSSCDGHWNALGHSLAAKIIVQQLHSLIPKKR